MYGAYPCYILLSGGVCNLFITCFYFHTSKTIPIYSHFHDVLFWWGLSVNNNSTQHNIKQHFIYRKHSAHNTTQHIFTYRTHSTQHHIYFKYRTHKLYKTKPILNIEHTQIVTAQNAECKTFVEDWFGWLAVEPSRWI